MTTNTEDVKKYAQEMIELRRAIHRRPEEGWTEFETEWKLFKALKSLGWTVKTGTDAVDPAAVLGRSPELVEKAMKRAVANGVPEEFLSEIKGYTGMIAEFDTGRPGPLTGFRFDMDCVLVEEKHSAPHCPAQEGFDSTIPGAMHACGHDAHSSLGIGLAHWIKDNAEDLKGRFRLIFQPAEEGTRGAAPMVAAGAADGLDWLFCAHVGMNCKLGQAGVCRSGFLATTKIDIEFTGTPAHAGNAPEKGRSALSAAAAATLMIQGIPRHGQGASQVAVGRLNAGEGRNVTPVHAVMQCETRGQTEEINQFMVANVERIARGCADAYEVACEVRKVGHATTLTTTPQANDLLFEAGCDVVGKENMMIVDNAGGSEDSTLLIRKAVENGAQASFLILGCNHTGHHRSDFDVQDTETLPTGLAIVTGVCKRTNAIGA